MPHIEWYFILILLICLLFFSL